MSLAQEPEVVTWDKILSRSDLSLSRSDFLIYDHFLQIYKVANKGYASNYLLDKGLKDSIKSPRFAIFHEWLLDLKNMPQLDYSQLLNTCQGLSDRMNTSFGLPRKLLVQRLSFCRQLTLQKMIPVVNNQGGFKSLDIGFLKKYMSNFVRGKNQEDFIWFLKKLDSNENNKLIVTNLVTENSNTSKRPIPKEVLSELTITPDLTRQIQLLGFDDKSTEQVFNSEYSRMIEEAYKIIDGKNKVNSQTKITQIRTWLSLNLNRLNKEVALSRFADLGKNLWRNDLEASAQEAYDFVATHGTSDQKEDAWFYRIWIWGSKEDWKKVINWVERIGLNKNFDQLNDSRLKFWIAYAYQQTKEEKLAKNLWEKTIVNHPLSFYSIMATKSLRKFHPTSELKDYYDQVERNSNPKIDIKNIDSSVWETWKRLKAWARLDAKAFLNAEMHGLEKNMIPGIVQRASDDLKAETESDAYLISAAIVGSENNFLDSFRIIYKALGSKKVIFNRFLLELLYPKPFVQELTSTLKSYKIDPLILLSLIRQESVFNPQARSRVGARGLMQLMPMTAKRFQRGVGIKQLAIPKTNIAIGTKYFNQLMKRYDQNIVFVLAAYNAGETRVERWKKTYFNDDILISIENVPFLETRNYVKLIFRNLYFYKILNQPELKDTDHFNKIYDVELGFKR